MKKAGIFSVLLLVFALTGCSSQTGLTLGEADSSVGLYQLSPMDTLQISLLGIPTEKKIDTVIDEKGNITIPYIDEPVKASGITTSELEQKIQRIYTDRQIYRNITVNISTSAKSYYMDGEVARPQEYALNRRITLLQAIAAASGYTEYANKKNITITRNGRILKFNAKDIEKHPELDVTIEAGDRINIHRSMF
jgi:protein involved in polysaccharide export with SLBB domain